MMDWKRTAAVAAAAAMVLAACSNGAPSDTGARQDLSMSEPARGLAESADAMIIMPAPPRYPDPDQPRSSGFVDTATDPQSTFGLDVDTGSYTLVRNSILETGYVTPSLVRPEEFINYFDQNYANPDAALGITVDTATTPYSADPTRRVIRIGIQGRAASDEQRPAALTFVIDTSGSMQGPRRLGAAQAALARLVGELSADDTVSIVTYGTTARVVLGPTPVADTDRILDTISSLTTEGSTNAAEGLALGYEQARAGFKNGGINRVVLASDGMANVGTVDPAVLAAGIKADAESGIQLVTVGFGMGGYNDPFMEQLADRGDGFYAYVDTPDEAERLFVEDLPATLETIAKDAKIQVTFDPDQVRRYRLIGYENRALADDEFHDDSIDAGEIGAGHSATALYEVELTGAATESGDSPLGDVALRWLDPISHEPAEITATINGLGDGQGSEFDDAVPEFVRDVLVAMYAESLRNGTPVPEDLLAAAESLAFLIGDDASSEFAELVAATHQRPIPLPEPIID